MTTTGPQRGNSLEGQMLNTKQIHISSIPEHINFFLVKHGSGTMQNQGSNIMNSGRGSYRKNKGKRSEKKSRTVSKDEEESVKRY